MELEETLAREIWEAYATRNQTVIAFPTLHWDEVDEFTRGTWLLLARTALAFDTRQAVEVRLAPQELAALDAYISIQPAPPPSRQEAVRQILAATLAFSLPLD